MPQLQQGLIQIYTGDSKGKTTAAFGLALRASGHGLMVGVVQFMKGSGYYGEVMAAQRLRPNLEVYQYGRVCHREPLLRQGDALCNSCGSCFVIPGQATPEDIEAAKMAWERGKAMIASGTKDVVILDELLNAVSDKFNLVDPAEVVDFLEHQKPGHVEVVLTGRNAPDEIVAIADLVTEMKMVKHPYQKGIPARFGIEY